MRIIINTATTHQGGAIQVANSFLEECRSFEQHDFFVILSPKIGRNLIASDYPPNFRFSQVKNRPAERLLKAMKGDFFREIENSFRPDCVFTTTGPAYWRPLVPHLVGFNLPHYIYPESPFFKMISTRERIKWSMKKKAILYFFRRDSDALVCQTEDASSRVSKLMKIARVHTVSNTASQYFRNPPLAVGNKLGPRKNREYRLLMISAYHRHKNFEMVKEISRQLMKDGMEFVKIVLTLKPEDYERLFGEEDFPNVFNVGPVPLQECPALYQETDAVFLPTLLECFSASYPEAMISGKPILTSDLGFARSICGEAALYFDPTDAKAIANKIATLIHDPMLAETLIEKGKKRVLNFLNPRERASAYLALCQDLVEQGKDR